MNRLRTALHLPAARSTALSRRTTPPLASTVSRSDLLVPRVR